MTSSRLSTGSPNRRRKPRVACRPRLHGGSRSMPMAPDPGRGLGAFVGQPVELQVMAAPDILGGAVIHIGDLLVDASAQRRLDQVEEHLLRLEGATRGAQT